MRGARFGCCGAHDAAAGIEEREAFAGFRAAHVEVVAAGTGGKGRLAVSADSHNAFGGCCTLSLCPQDEGEAVTFLRSVELVEAAPLVGLGKSFGTRSGINVHVRLRQTALRKAERNVRARDVGVGRVDGDLRIVFKGHVEVALHCDGVAFEAEAPHLGMLVADAHVAELVYERRNLAAEALGFVQFAVSLAIERNSEGPVALFGGVGRHTRVSHEPSRDARNRHLGLLRQGVALGVTVIVVVEAGDVVKFRVGGISRHFIEIANHLILTGIVVHQAELTLVGGEVHLNFFRRGLAETAVLGGQRNGVRTFFGEEESGVLLGRGCGVRAGNAPLVFSSFGGKVNHLHGRATEYAEARLVNVVPRRYAELGGGAHHGAFFKHRYVVDGNVAARGAFGGKVHGKAVLAAYHRHKLNFLLRPAREALPVEREERGGLCAALLVVAHGYRNVGGLQRAERHLAREVEIEAVNIRLAGFHVEERRVKAFVAQEGALGRDEVISAAVGKQSVHVGGNKRHCTRASPARRQLRRAVVVFVFIVERLLVRQFLRIVDNGRGVFLHILERARRNRGSRAAQGDTRHFEHFGGNTLIVERITG